MPIPMKKEKLFLFLGLVLALCLVVGVFLPNHASAEEISATVYVSAAGSSTNDGLTEDSPVSNMAEAYNALYAAMQANGLQNKADAAGQIVLLSDQTIELAKNTVTTVQTEFGKHVFKVVITAKNDAALTFRATAQAYYQHIGPTEYHDIKLYNSTRFTTLHAAPNSALIIGENVETKPDATYNSYLSLVGGPKAAFTGDTHLEVHSGTWGNIYAGTYSSAMTGTANLLMTGGTCTKLGSTYNVSVNGDVYITVTGGSVENVYGGEIQTGATAAFGANVHLSFSDMEITGDFKAGGYTKVTKDIYLDLKNVKVANPITADCSGTVHTTLTADSGKTLTLLGAGTLAAESFTGGGNLVLGADTKLALGKVTGSTQFTVSPAPKNTTYITAPDSTPDDAFVYGGTEGMKCIRISGAQKGWSMFDESTFKGIKLYAPADVNVTFRSGFSINGAAVTPDIAFEEDGVRYQYYSSIATGNYCFTTSGNGYYRIVKNVYVSAAKMATLTEISADPGKVAGNGYEAGVADIVKLYTDETIENVTPSDPSLWPEYAHVFTTPAFTENKAAHEFTSQEEMMAFLEALDGTSVHAYRYVLARSGAYNNDIPIVVFTTSDLSGAKTWEEAAAIVRKNGKPTVHYQAQIHGNEPAAGEGALAMIQALYGSYGEKLLRDINIYVIPRVNPDGSYVFTRNDVALGANLNRDMMTAESVEVQALRRVTIAFDPAAVVDAHEFTVDPTVTSGAYNDILLSSGGGINNGEALRDLGVSLMRTVFSDLSDNGIRAFAYPNVETSAGGNTANSVNPTTGRLYNCLSGSLCFLVETRGINDGRSTFARRVVAQYMTIESILDSVAANAAEVRETVAAEKADIISCGKTYEEDDVIVLETDTSKAGPNDFFINRPLFNFATGVMTNSGSKTRVCFFDTIIRSRPRPTAYVLPKGEAWVEKVLFVASLHGITYTELEPGAAVMLQQYGGTKTLATLSEERITAFTNGAYVFTMDQESAVILSLLMEPDVGDAKEGTASFVQSGVISSSGGVFPIYRYIHDLNEDGSIDFVKAPDAPEDLEVVQPAEEGGLGKIIGLDPTKQYEYRHESEAEHHTVPAGSSEIPNLEIGKYFVRFVSGADGLTGQEAELEVIDAHMTQYVVYLSPASGNDANIGRTKATAVRTLEAAYDRLAIVLRHAPEGQAGTIILCDTLTFTADDVQFPSHPFPVILRGITDDVGIYGKSNIYFNGDTTLEHMTVKLTANLYRFLYGNGNRFVIGESVTTLPTTNYYGVAGGSYSTTVASTDITITSGTWRTAYAGNYTSGTILGDAKLTITGGEIVNQAESSYGCTINGNVTISLQNVKVGANPLCAANAYKNNIQGDLTYILGEGAEINELYAGSRDAGDVLGTVRVVLDGATVTKPIHGKGQNGTVGASELILKSGTFAAQTTDFGKIILDSSEGGTLTVRDNLTVDEVIGGGTLNLPTGKKLTVSGAISGTTQIALSEKTSQELTVVQGGDGISASAFVLADSAYVVKSAADNTSWIVNADDVPKLSFYGASITLQDNLQVNFYVKKASVADGAQLASEITFCGKTVAVDEWEDAGEYWVYRFCDVAPQRMNDAFNATLTAVSGDVTAVSAPLSYSVVDYCMNQLSRTDNGKLRTLLVDLLHYGAAAQQYVGYETETLANASLSAQQLAWGTPVEEDLNLQYALNTAVEEVSDPQAAWAGAGLYLQDSITMRFYFKADSIEGLTAHITDDQGKLLAEIPYTAFVNTANGWQISFRGMNAGKMKTKVWISLQKDGVAVSNTLQYSIESYAYAKQDSTIAYLGDLCKAMMRYGNAAYAYAN